MKILIDEMPVFEQECPFYIGYECSLDRTKCEHMHLSSKERCQQTECRWLKEYNREE
jgi:hypothetical protein